MTDINYPDCSAVSSNGLFLLEARSPDNGSIKMRDGSASDHPLGCSFQRHFRYRLMCRSSPRADADASAVDTIIWERWQEGREGSPHELVVADDGWSAIRTHGFDPAVILLRPDGSALLRVRVTAAGDAEGPDDKGTSPRNADRLEGEREVAWQATNLSMTTAGAFWAGNSWPYFCECELGHYFVWRTFWGDRLIVDLDLAKLVTDDEITQRLSDAFDCVERNNVNIMFDDLMRHFEAAQSYLTRRHDDSERQWPSSRHPVRRLLQAFHLISVHQMREYLPLLRSWEVIDCPSSSTGCVALRDHWWVESQFLRAVICQSTRSLGVEPRGYPSFNFRRSIDEPSRFALPECLSDRRDRLQKLGEAPKAADVLSVVGAPDHIRKRSHPVERGFYGWTEEWEYDVLVGGNWRTLRLTWEEVGKASRLRSKNEESSYWLTSKQRTMEQLSW
jgi:hypothetical protein